MGLFRFAIIAGMSKPVVVITETLDEQCAAWLGEHAQVVWAGLETDELARRLPEADGLVVRTYTQVDGGLLDRAPRLKVIGRAGVGLDNFDLEACRSRGVAVVYTPDANTQAVVEYVFGLILDRYRPRTDLPADAGAEQFHALRKTEVGRQIDQMTLGILGFGRIGKRVGQVARAVGMNLKVCDLLPEAELRKAVDYPFEFVDHQTLLHESEIVTVHVDGRRENRHLLDAELLKYLRPDAMLLNAARGMLVDPAALADWAKSHPAGSIVLDVHDPEPPRPDDPLMGIRNVRLLPHLASRTYEALANMSWVVRDVVRVLQGEAPRYPAVNASSA